MLHLLPSLATEMVIPQGVYKEIFDGSPGDPARKWLNGPGRVFVREIGPLEPEVLKWNLGLSELPRVARPEKRGTLALRLNL